MSAVRLQSKKTSDLVASRRKTTLWLLEKTLEVVLRRGTSLVDSEVVIRRRLGSWILCYAESSLQGRNHTINRFAYSNFQHYSA